MIRLGGPILDPPNDPEELARTHLACGYRAAYCPKVSLSDKNRIREIRRAFKKYDVLIAEVGAWCNLISIDPAERNKNFKHVCERLALADEIGARCCVDFIGTFDPDSSWGPHPDNLSADTFELTVHTIRRILDEVKPGQAKDIVLKDKLSLHLDEAIPGTGNLDYKTYLTELNRLPNEVPIMLEHLSSAEEYTLARDYLFCLGKDLGISFGE